eukprot:TRINITY_DN5564_c0_g1_i2.p1 TRINITY_DN5564_c0_g1~~TRINITY_DN5564_c0_g1_i2.p1  ORF type:complete len:757 (+),score=150.22 TRINITY_DN5564_c0_g1_i2:51-2273(+)
MSGKGKGLPLSMAGGYHRGGLNSLRQTGPPPRIEVYTSNLRLQRMDGATMPKHPEVGGGCPWVNNEAVGRDSPETALVQPDYKRHDTSGEPCAAFGLEPLDVNFEGCTIEELQDQVLKAVSKENITPKQSLDILRVLSSKPGGKPTVACLNRVLTTCKAHGNSQDAIRAFKFHHGRELADSNTFRIVSDIAKICQSLELAHVAVASIEARKVKPDSRTMSSLTSVVMDGKTFDKSRMTISQKGPLLNSVLLLNKAENISLTSVQKCYAVTKLALCGCQSEALQFFKDTHTETSQYSPEVYNQLLEAATEHDASLLPVVFRHMQKAGIEPSKAKLLKCFDTLYTREEYLNEARRIYDIIKSEKSKTPKTTAEYVSMEGLALKRGVKGGPGKNELLKMWDEIAASKQAYKDDLPQNLVRKALHALVVATFVEGEANNLKDTLTDVALLCKQQHTNECYSKDTIDLLLSEIGSGKVTPPTRGAVSSWELASFTTDIKNNSLDVWAFKAMCHGLEKCDPTAAKWSRQMAELLAKSTAGEEEKEAEEDLDAEMELAALLEGSDDGVETKQSFFTPQLGQELTATADYVIVLDSAACNELFSNDANYKRLVSIVRNAQPVKCLISPATQLSLSKDSPAVLSVLMKEYAERQDSWVIPLPLSVHFEVATNPFRSRPRKRRRLTADQRSQEPAPSLTSEIDMLVALCYRLQGTENIGRDKTILVSNSEENRKTATEQKKTARLLRNRR